MMLQAERTWRIRSQPVLRPEVFSLIFHPLPSPVFLWSQLNSTSRKTQCQLSKGHGVERGRRRGGLCNSFLFLTPRGVVSNQPLLEFALNLEKFC